MQRSSNFPFKITSLIVALLPFILLCTPRREPAPVETEETLPDKDMARAESIYHRALEGYRAERWSVAANGFDRLLDRYPETVFTGNALVLATESDLKADRADRARQRLFEFRDFLLRDLEKDNRSSGEKEVVLGRVIRRYVEAGLQGDGLRLVFDIVPPKTKAKDLRDEIYRDVEYLAYQLPREDLDGLIEAYPDHVFTPVLRIHLARQAVMDGEAERAMVSLSGIRTRSLRPEERKAVREIRAAASGKETLEGKIALLLPLTGSYSPYARAVLKGVQLALHPTGGGTNEGIGLQVFDTGREFTDLMETIDRIVDDPEFLAVIGPLSSSLTVSISRKFQEKDLTLISPTASERGINDLGDNIYSLNLVDESLATRIADFAVNDLGLRTFAALFPMDDYGYRMVKAFIRRVEDLGGEVAVAQGYPISATTFDAELKRIRYYSPEAIFIPAHSEEIPMIAPQITFYGMEDVQILGTNGWNNRRVARLGGKYVEGAFFTDTFFESSPQIGYREFSRRYEEVFKEESSRVAGYGFDAMNLIKWGLRAGGEGGRSRSIDFSNLKDFRGATAVYSMGDDGAFRKEPLLLTINGGKIVAVEDLPADRSGGEGFSTEQPAPADPMDIQSQTGD